jgi:low affinity Fe/Cu permease
VIPRILTTIGTYTSHVGAFVIWAAYICLWLIFDPQSHDWLAVATMVTWLMTLFIQRAERRDTQAIQGKLDEILRALGDADNEIMHLDKKEPEEIEEKRRDIQRAPDQA